LSGRAEDVEIWSLTDVSGSHEDADVAEFVWSYRNDILGPRGIPPEQVAPNHILVPAPNYHECPWGPPGPADALQLPTMRALSVNVGVLDSGWEAAGPAKDLVAASEYGGWLDTTSYSWETSTAAS